MTDNKNIFNLINKYYNNLIENNFQKLLKFCFKHTVIIKRVFYIIAIPSLLFFTYLSIKSDHDYQDNAIGFVPDYWYCTENGWVDTTVYIFNYRLNPAVPCNKESREKVITKYINDNISRLSPEKESLGGKFYVTKINFINGKTGSVTYEDGHASFNANFGYEVFLNNSNFTLNAMIHNFKISK